ncbi:hypothetical protein CsSME_00003083 [Camellia sinensis var. sinensis]
MGSCLSKKTTICSSPNALPDPPPNQTKTNTNPQLIDTKKPEEETLKKEIFVIKHRKSHDIDRRSDEEKPNPVHQKIQCTATSTDTSASESADLGNNNNNNTSSNGGGFPNGGIVVRTSSCTKEEVDAILIQCGRLSRSSSAGKATALSGSGHDRKYSGSKRSYDFDHETPSKDKKKGNGFKYENYDDEVVDGDDDETVAERIHRHRQRHRQSRPSSSSSSRRRTPSRERDQQQQQQQQRSGSRERGSSGSGGGRRVSRSPGRRSESPITGGATTSSANAGGCRPGKMVSVPATDKSNNGGGGGVEAPPVKRISVKRNAGGEAAAMGCRSVASPRSQSPARVNGRGGGNENQNGHTNQPLSLSRSNSRKAEHSPYRRNPLAEIDQNCVGFEVPLHSNKADKNSLSQAPMQKQSNNENVKSNKVTVQGTDNKTNTGKDNKYGTSSCRANEQQQGKDDGKILQPTPGSVALTVVPSGPEILKPQTITRSRSSRLSRDLDLNPDTLLNPAPSSYTALLLEDIQNFHQKGTPAISLPPCVTKACSILEAVADLNSSSSNPVGKKRLESKDPFVESEVLVSDDLTEPSFHKYVTTRRGTVGGDSGDVEEQESSGSNSFVVGGQQHWASSSSWEPNSADSTDHWTSSRSNTREDNRSPPGFQRHALSEPRCDSDHARRKLSEKKRESDDRQQNGIGRGRVGSSRGLHSTPPLAAVST